MASQPPPLPPSAAAAAHMTAQLFPPQAGGPGGSAVPSGSAAAGQIPQSQANATGNFAVQTDPTYIAHLDTQQRLVALLHAQRAAQAQALQASATGGSAQPIYSAAAAPSTRSQENAAGIYAPAPHLETVPPRFDYRTGPTRFGPHTVNTFALEDRTYLFDYSGDVIQVLIGEEREVFVVPRMILEQTSAYFAASCSRPWQNSKATSIELPWAKVTCFNYYLNWIYRRILVTDSVTHGPMPDFCTESDEHWETLVDLFLFADRVCDDDYRDAICDRMVLQALELRNKQAIICLPSAALVNRIWEFTPATALVRQLIIDLYVAAGGADRVNDELCAEFLFGLCKNLMRPDSKSCTAFQVFRAAQHCEYHAHRGTSEPCYTSYQVACVVDAGEQVSHFNHPHPRLEWLITDPLNTW